MLWTFVYNTYMYEVSTLLNFCLKLLQVKFTQIMLPLVGTELQSC